MHKTTKQQVKIAAAVIVRTDDKNRGKWPLAVVQQLYPGSDGQIRAVLLKTKNGTIEVQHQYPLELQCDIVNGDTPKVNQLNPNARAFKPKRAAAVEALKKMRRMTEMDENK